MFIVWGVLLAALSAALSAAPSGPAPLDPASADSIKAAIVKDREDTEDWLRGKPTSYLATVLRRDFGEAASLSVGSAADNDVRIEDPAVLPHHLRVAVAGDSFRVEAVDPAATFRIKDREPTSATVGPSGIGVGRFTLRLSHQRYPAIIVFDPMSPRFKEYKGIKYFPVDFSYRFALALTPNEAPDTTMIISTRGNQRRAVRVGWFDFVVDKTPCRLEAVRLLEPGVGERDLSVFFRDATTGKETYTVGRYVDPQPLPGGRYMIDFNVAYNPACAYSEHYNCPIPQAANTLPVAIRAGEKDSHYLAH
jgi:uncharacterized protein (DUF1684 family)